MEREREKKKKHDTDLTYVRDYNVWATSTHRGRLIPGCDGALFISLMSSDRVVTV